MDHPSKNQQKIFQVKIGGVKILTLGVGVHIEILMSELSKARIIRV